MNFNIFSLKSPQTILTFKVTHWYYVAVIVIALKMIFLSWEHFNEVLITFMNAPYSCERGHSPFGWKINQANQIDNGGQF